MVCADEPRGSAPIHQRVRSGISFSEGRSIDRRSAEHTQPHSDRVPSRQAQLTTPSISAARALFTLKKANTIGRYDSPYRRGLRAGFYDKDGYFNGIWASLMVFLYNTKQLNKAEAPKSINDLLQPRWKGKMGMDQDADDWLAALLEYYGDEKGKQIARSLGGQSLNIRKGRTLVSQLVAAGEFPLADRRPSSRGHCASQSRRAHRLCFSRAVYSGKIGFFPGHGIAAATPARGSASGRLYDFEKRPGNRLQTTALARVQRSRHGRSG